MKLLKILFKSLLALILLLVVVSFFLPPSSSVSRSVVVNEQPAEVFPYINDFREFNRWSPWYGIDPNTQYVFSGPEKGIGSKMTWSSEDPSVGKGSQEIVEVVDNERVTTDLAFDGQGQATADYLLRPVDGGTEVTWQFKSEWGFNPLGRYMGLMMDDLVGSSYEEGLQKLKVLVESE